jgi:hypothetical protein
MMMWCRSQFELATLIRVQNLSQTATDFRKKWYIWDLHRNIQNDRKHKKMSDAGHAKHINYRIK